MSDDGHKLYRIRQTCMKMLDKRGYNVLQEHVAMTSDKFVEDFGPDPKREDMTLLVEKVGKDVTLGVCAMLYKSAVLVPETCALVTCRVS